MKPRGLLLALETSTSVGSVAIARGSTVLARVELGRQRAHASRLLPAIAEALSDAGRTVDELDGVVVGAGPGSFTGVRVAAATAKGLVHAKRIPLFAYSSLAAGAAWFDAAPRGVARYVLIDARADRVFAGCYLIDERGLDVLVAPHATTIGELLAQDLPHAVFAGDGAERHADMIRGAGFEVLRPPYGQPTADGLIRIAGLGGESGFVSSPGEWEPDYLRETGAERAAADV